MASPPNGSDQDRPAASSRSRSGLPNMLPTSIGKRNRSKSRSRPGPAPHMGRSISSAMTDSFMLDHRGSYRSSPNDRNTTNASHLQKTEDDDGLTPISNWAHLNFLKNQRNTLRNELKVQALAGAEAKRSVSSLRRLAFRMAVNISVKEKQIATSAKNLSQSRKGNYLQGKDAEKRIESLKRALRIEEKRNVEVLEALERASMLTLQYSTPKPKSQHRPQRSLLSPPPSPPTRLSDYSEPSLGSPRTPTRPNTFEWSLTPGLESPAEVRTSDSRLIQAKRDCDRALAACRSRITELQEECAQSKETNEVVLASRDELEYEIKSHQSRIATLERSRAAVEATLSATRQQLALMKEAEQQLKQDLNSKAQEISKLEHGDEQKHQTINIIREEKTALEEQLQIRTSELQELENRTSTLEAGTQTLQNKLESAERYEASLQGRLTEREHLCKDLQKRFDRGTQYIQLLEHKIQGFESDALEHSRLQVQLQKSKVAADDSKAALATLESEVAALRQNLEKELHAHKQLSTEVEVNHATILELKDEHAVALSALEQERDMKYKLRTEIESVRSSYDLAITNLQAAEVRIQSLEDFDHDTRNKLEALHDNKMALEADLKDARQSLFRLHEEKRMGEAELSRMVSSRLKLQEEFQTSERRVGSLQEELEEARIAGAAMQETHAMDLQKNKAQLTEFETSLRELKMMLVSADQEKLGLQEKLHQIQASKESTERQLTEALESRDSLRSRYDSIEDQLTFTKSERNTLVTHVAQLENDLAIASTAKSVLEERLDDTSKRHNELESLASELQSSLKASRDASHTFEAAYSMAQIDGDSSRAQIAHLHEQVNEAKAAKEEAEDRYNASENSKTLLEGQLLVAQSKLAEVELESASIRAELSAVHTKLSQYGERNASLTASLEAVQMQYNDQKEELAVVKSCWETAEHKTKTLQLELSMAQEELGFMHREKLRTEKHLEEAIEYNKSLDSRLSTARQDRANAEERLTAALGLSLQATSELASTQSQLVRADSDKARLVCRLDEKERELEALLQCSAEIQSQLNQASARVATLEDDLSVTRSRLLELDSDNQSHVAKLTANDETFTRLQHQETDLREKLAQALAYSTSLEEDAAHMHKRVLELEKSTAGYLSQLSNSSAETETLRAANAQFEDRLQTVTRHNDDLERDAHATAMRLDIAEVEGLRSAADLLEADHALKALHEVNAKLEQSEQHLSKRLASVEEDLDTVRQTNTHLEAILERVTKDMDKAEATVKESSKQFAEYLTESQAKLEAARSAKSRYKNRLSEKTSEMETLTAENLDLHKQVDEQSEELVTLKKGKAKLEETLSSKDKYMKELRSSSDKRIRSLNSAYNALRKEHEQRVKQTRPAVEKDNTRRLEAELRFKDAEMEKMKTSIDSYAALEHEVRSLREDKKVFQRLVEQLQHKMQQLQVLEDWEEPTQVGSPSSPPHVTISDDTFYSLPSSPSTRHTRSPRPDSVFSMGHPGDRPITRASAHSHDDDLDSWAQEVERVRMLRDETAIQLRDLRRSKHDLKKDLKNTEAELHRLEKEHKDKRYRNLLRKGHRPTTPFRSPVLPSEPIHTHTLPLAPTTPTRPRTSSGIPLTPSSNFKPSHQSRHSTIGMPQETFATSSSSSTSSPQSRHKPWPTTLRHTNATNQRPDTGHSMRQRLSHRTTTSVGEEEHGGKDRRKWSSGLRSLFRTEG